MADGEERRGAGGRPSGPGGGRGGTRRSRYVARPVERPTGGARPDPTTPRGRRTVYGAGGGGPSAESVAYVVVFGLIALGLVAFVYVGLQWATGTGPAAGLGAAIAPPTMAVPSPSPLAVPSPSPSPSPVAAPPVTYVVKPGDNPASIAREHGVTTEALMTANNIENPSSLQVGQVLRIPPTPTPRPR